MRCIRVGTGMFRVRQDGVFFVCLLIIGFFSSFFFQLAVCLFACPEAVPNIQYAYGDDIAWWVGWWKLPYRRWLTRRSKSEESQQKERKQASE